MDEWKDWEGKQVYVRITAGREYSGKVIQIEEEDKKVFITLLDIYNKKVKFSSSEVKLIQEEGAPKHAKG